MVMLRLVGKKGGNCLGRVHQWNIQMSTNALHGQSTSYTLWFICGPLHYSSNITPPAAVCGPMLLSPFAANAAAVATLAHAHSHSQCITSQTPRYTRTLIHHSHTHTHTHTHTHIYAMAMGMRRYMLIAVATTGAQTAHYISMEIYIYTYINIYIENPNILFQNFFPNFSRGFTSNWATVKLSFFLLVSNIVIIVVVVLPLCCHRCRSSTNIATNCTSRVHPSFAFWLILHESLEYGGISAVCVQCNTDSIKKRSIHSYIAFVIYRALECVFHHHPCMYAHGADLNAPHGNLSKPLNFHGSGQCSRSYIGLGERRCAEERKTDLYTFS